MNNYEKDKYCSQCGSKMKHTKILINYDTSNGKPVYGNKYICPKWRFWQFTIHDWYNDYEIICPY